jgi:hypothetical protein
LTPHGAPSLTILVIVSFFASKIGALLVILHSELIA